MPVSARSANSFLIVIQPPSFPSIITNIENIIGIRKVFLFLQPGIKKESAIKTLS
ncbi:hypothetical protein BRDCF_p2066 [Bacteroidales bacterium CF]|nr:hypothetical protein BRDCF_p2066 [Bacteroidales bacterium CF]